MLVRLAYLEVGRAEIQAHQAYSGNTSPTRLFHKGNVVNHGEGS
jgi:hypothetical protein